MKKKQYKWIIAIIVILAIAYGGYRYFFAKKATPIFRTAKVELGDVAELVTASGTLQATNQVDVGSQVSGTIQNLYVDYNSRVKKGQLIAQIDPRTMQSQVTQNQANLAAAEAGVKNAQAAFETAKANIANLQAALLSAKANAAKAKSTMDYGSKNYERYKQLRAENLVSQNDLETAQTSYETAKASYDAAIAQITSNEAQIDASKASARAAETNIDSAKADVSKAKAALQQSQLNLDYTRITAPVNGTVISKNVEVGQTVAASLQAPTLFSIAEDLTKMQAIASIDEADVGNVKEGQKATFTVDAYPNRNFEGVVSQIRSQPINVQNVITYQGVIDVVNPNFELRPGMTANISFIIAETNNTLKVPVSALRFKLATTNSTQSTANKNGTTTRNANQSKPMNIARTQRPKLGKVYIFDQNKQPKAVEVKLGISDGNFTAIEAGPLEEGQEVIVGYTTPTASTARSPLTGGMGGPRGR
jgi:HlyD family secretion protein